MRSFTTVMLVLVILMAGISYGMSAYELMAGTYDSSWLFADLVTTPLALAVNGFLWWVWHSDETEPQ